MTTNTMKAAIGINIASITAASFDPSSSERSWKFNVLT